MKHTILFGLSLFFFSITQGQNQITDTLILIENVNIFNGIDKELTHGNVLIRNHKIDQISTSKIPVEGTPTIIDGKDNYLIPGLIDAHTHITLEELTDKYKNADWGLINIIAVKAAKRQLLRGFTTIRNMGGNAIPLATAIDDGLAVGPRIYPSGAFISQSGGHGDNGLPTDVPRTHDQLSYSERTGQTAIADGTAEVLKRVREQLRQGATQIKMMAGGGISSDYDPLDVSQYTVEEFKAAVSAAENFNTYVAVHVYTPKAIQAAIEGGVKSIEHGHLIDEETAQLMAEKGIWWDIQPFIDDEDAPPFPELNRKKWIEVTKGTDNAYKLAKKYGVKTAFGTDITNNPDRAEFEGKWLAKLKNWYTPYEILKMATSQNAELLQLSGKRNPYQKGPIGEITEGAYADMILVNGNPLENIDLVAKPHESFILIMKDGVIYKNMMKKD